MRLSTAPVFLLQLADFGSARSAETVRQRANRSQHQRQAEASSDQSTFPAAGTVDGAPRGLAMKGRFTRQHVAGTTGLGGPADQGLTAGSSLRAAAWFQSQDVFLHDAARTSPTAGAGGRTRSDALDGRARGRCAAERKRQHEGSPMDADDVSVDEEGGGPRGEGAMVDIYAQPSDGPEGGFRVGRGKGQWILGGVTRWRRDVHS